ncbi:accessory Sec system S-layer assembly protein [Fictibacillus barbaricus]|uniref:Accessory Sec system S-layer assembly protein n=1 Tax=Fictibacillus barbaricus TaxID=182136 RepID=A0ABS2ZG43_9BACL|nr:accessory Sec system S-layer assembly protein [Fictibacillus barbaricus]MBN3546736.1 accessory Sec system S-layer assembly protein [Fictibacillus barbaricus]GGB43460.1 accessory Sec system S-layer assembly protein [Fictibacillus barbaricus]
MWSLLKRKKDNHSPSLDSDTSQVVDTAEEEKPGRTQLFIHPAVVVSPQEKYVFQFYHQLLPDLKPNQISINGYELMEFNDSVIIEGFIRNTLPSKIRFEEVILLIMDSDSRILARKVFDFNMLGELPPSSSIPWKFLFEPEDFLVNLSEWNKDDWKLAFELKKQNPANETLELEASWEERLSEEEQKDLRKLISTLPPLKNEEVNLFGLKAERSNEKNVALTLLIRNGTGKKIELSQLPLQLESEDGKIIASGLFQLKDFSISPYSCKPWTFIFPENLVLAMPEEFTSWKVSVPSAG